MNVDIQNYQNTVSPLFKIYQVFVFLITKLALIKAKLLTFALVIGVFLSPYTTSFAADGFNIDSANWNAERSRLVVNGTGINRLRVTLSNADTSDALGTNRIRDKKWRFTLRNPGSVPCRVKAEQSDGIVAELNVNNAPTNCDGGVIEPPAPPPSPPPTGSSGAIRIIAANDLGMHCADKDYQVFSILPPFNVVHAQAIQKGTGASLPRILSNNDVDVTYQAASSPNDPAGANSINTSSNIPGVFKTNFWEKTGTSQIDGYENTLGGLTYGRLYPSVLAGALLDPPQDFTALCTAGVCPSILNLFEPLPIDTGLPVPELGDLANGVLTTYQQTMPGPGNDPVLFKRFDQEVHFFGGTIPDTNWFVADGVPILPVDDVGNSNAYPLMKVSATHKTTGATLDSVDLVLPLQVKLIVRIVMLILVMEEMELQR